MVNEHQAFFDEIDNQKQERFDERVTHYICKQLGLSGVEISYLRSNASKEKSALDGFTPEWLSEALVLPITFFAVKDYLLEKKDLFPEPLWLLEHRIDGKKCRKFYNKLWADIVPDDGFGYAGCVFRTKWSNGLICLHNYKPVLDHVPSQSYPVNGGFMTWRSEKGFIMLQYLKDIVSVLRKKIGK
jgi:hypothetical protein